MRIFIGWLEVPLVPANLMAVALTSAAIFVRRPLGVSTSLASRSVASMALCSDSRRPVPGVQAYALNIEIAVENDSEDLLLHHPQVHLPKIAIAANKLGLGQVSAVDILVLGVVLKKRRALCRP